MQVFLINKTALLLIFLAALFLLINAEAAYAQECEYVTDSGACSGIIHTGWIPSNYTQGTYYIAGYGCSDGSSAITELDTSGCSAPTASINAFDCSIPAGGSTCNATVTWSSNSQSPSVSQDGSAFSTLQNGSAERTLSYGAHTFSFLSYGVQITSDSAVASCTGGASWNGSMCSFACVGTAPSNATLCTGDSTGLSADTSRTLVSACSPAKCEYTCNSSYTLYNGSCVSGSLIMQCLAPRVNAALTAGASTVSFGSPTTLSWTTTNTTSCTVTSLGNSDSWTGTSNTGVSTSPLTGTTTYVLTCGGTILDTETVTVFAQPTIAASSRTVEPGTLVTLTYDTQGQTCSLNEISGITTGSRSVIVNATTVYTLSCPGGSTSITIEIAPRLFET